MRWTKGTKATWTRVRSGTWTWRGYTAQRVWVYEGRQSTHYWVWNLSYDGTHIGEYPGLYAAKQAAAQREGYQG